MSQLKNVIDAVKGIGLVGERKALALACLGFFSFFFLMMGLLLLANPDPELGALAPSMLGLGGCYLLAFYALAADWFWARWFATGLGYWGLTTAAIVTLQVRMILTPMVIFFATHAIIWAVLLGDKMAAAYDNREDWRKRFELDEQGVHRVRNTVTRVSTGLPMLILWALAPKPGDEALYTMSGFVALAAAVFGLAAVLQARTWGVFVLGLGGVAALVSALSLTAIPSATLTSLGVSVGTASGAPLLFPFSAFAAALLLAAAAPYFRPVLAFIRRSR